MKRIEWIDWAKAILLYLMVAGHCGLHGTARDMVYAFHMPAFFLVSGFLYHEHHWKATAKSLFYPVAVIAVFNCAYYLLPLLLNHQLDVAEFARCAILSMIERPYQNNLSYHFFLFPGFWFILVLFVCRMLMGDVKLPFPLLRHGLLVIIVCTLYMSFEPLLPLPPAIKENYVYKVIPCLPFLLVGYYAKSWFSPSKFSTLHLIVMGFVFVAVACLSKGCDIYENNYGIHYIIYFLNAIIGTIVLLCLCSHLRPQAQIVVFSQGTLFVLGVHFVLRNILANVLTLFLPSDSPFYPWTLAVIIMLICYYPIKWIDKHYPMMLGKRHPKKDNPSLSIN